MDQVGYFNHHLHGDNIVKQDSAEPWLNHFPSQLQLAAKFLQSWISSSVRTIKPIFLSEFPGVLRISHAQNFWHVEVGPQYTLTSAVNVIIVRRTEQQHGKLRSKVKADSESDHDALDKFHSLLMPWSSPNGSILLIMFLTLKN